MSDKKYLAPKNDGIRKGPHRSAMTSSNGWEAHDVVDFGKVVRVCLHDSQIQQDSVFFDIEV